MSEDLIPDEILRLLNIIQDDSDNDQTRNNIILPNVQTNDCVNLDPEEITKCNNNFANDIFTLHKFIFPRVLPLVTSTNGGTSIDNKEVIPLSSIIDIYNLLNHLRNTVDLNPDKIITRLLQDMFTLGSENIPSIISKYGSYLLTNNILYEVINIIMWFQSKAFYIKSDYVSSSRGNDEESSVLKRIIVQQPQMTAFDLFLKSLLFNEYTNIFGYNFEYNQHVYVKEIEKNIKCITQITDYKYTELNNHIIKHLSLDSTKCQRLTNTQRRLKNKFTKVKKNYSKNLLFLELNNRRYTNYMNFYVLK